MLLFNIVKNSVDSGPEREHGLTYPGENGRMPTDIGADGLLVAQRRQPEVVYGLHYRPHRCEPIVSRYEVLKCGVKKVVLVMIILIIII